MQKNFLNHEVDLYKINELDSNQRQIILLAVQSWFPNNQTLPSYLEKRLDSYQYILLSSKKERLVGVFFIDNFNIGKELFLYIGSCFAKDFYAYAKAFMFIFNHYSEQYDTIYLLAEAQNPTILMHWHILFPKSTTFSAMNHQNLTSKEWENIQLYQKNISHFTDFDREDFKTKSRESLFEESKKQQDIVDYLEKQNIHLKDGDSMVLYTAFRYSDLPQMINTIRSGIKDRHRLKQQFTQTLLESKMSPAKATQFDKAAIYAMFEQNKITEHPLIAAISQLSLKQEQVVIVALNIYHVVKNFPRFMSAIITNIGQHEKCMVLVDNLYEEYGRMNKEHIHLYTYRQFVQQLGIPAEMIDAFTPHVSVIAYVRSVLDLCLHHPYREGLAALGIIEDIVHQVSDIIGITANKEKTVDEHVFHFAEHKVLDERHADEIYDLLDYENDEHIQQIKRGLDLGFYYHLKLYSDIYQQAMKLTPEVKRPEVRTESNMPYPLAVGEKGDRRLSILNRLYNSNSIALIKQFVDGPEYAILELGCGTGQLSYELSQQVSANITATDSSPEQIDMAQKKYKHKHLQFKCCDATNLSQLKQRFDVIYMRWVLIYLPEAQAIIKACYEQLNPNGVLIIEDNDASFSACSSPDKMELIADWEEIWQQGIEAISGNTTLSVVVQNTLQALGMKEINYGISQSLLQNEEDKLLFALGIEESRNTFLQLGFNDQIVDTLRDKFAQIATSTYPVAFVRNFQLSARK